MKQLLNLILIFLLLASCSSDKEEPIKCDVKYELNGAEIDSKDIVGKSGKVKVTLSYTNNDVHTVKVNGKYEKMYTPFVVVAGTLIDGKKNTNVEVKNGKVLDNGNKVTAIGMALPGLQDSLKISKDKVEIPSTIEISIRVETTTEKAMIPIISLRSRIIRAFSS